MAAPESDRELVSRCVRGDADAWSEFVRRYIRLVVHVVRATLHGRGRSASEEDVDDVTHEVYAHLCDRNFRALRNLHEPFNLKAWLAVGARRKALDHLKKRQLIASSLDQPMTSDPGSSPLERLVGRSVDPATGEGEEIRLVVDQAPLNSKEKLVITLFFFKDASYIEISKLIGMPENSIGPTLRRGLDKIKEELHKRGWVK